MTGKILTREKYQHGNGKMARKITACSEKRGGEVQA
jgi:hypothetical protein